MRRWTRWLLVVIALGIIGALIWAATPIGPTSDAADSLVPDEAVTVRDDRWVAFLPTQFTDTGLIFYPGGRIHPDSYAPAAHAIAARGYLVVVVPMPFNLAVLSPNRAEEVIAGFPEIEHWVVGGHSLGGAMAAQFARSHPEAVDGVVLWAAFPAVNTDLSAAALAVVSIYGTSDCVATVHEIEAAMSRLPSHTDYVPIEGGNHAQFGNYGDQKRDCPASIDRSDQQESAVAATVKLLQAASR